jgi:AraC-like DNA-binding protein
MAYDGTVIRPAECQWHLVLAKKDGWTQMILTGPLSESGEVRFTPGAELLWIRFKLGVFLPHLPARRLRDRETLLPAASGRSFWLHSATWAFPNYENVDTFVSRLARDELLVRDPLVDGVLQGRVPKLSARTIRHRFLQSTGVTHNHILQVERARRAADRLRAGTSILDTVHQLGYYDQPHLTRALRRWIGHTPAELYHPIAPHCHSVQDEPALSEYHAAVIEHTV